MSMWKWSVALAGGVAVGVAAMSWRAGSPAVESSGVKVVPVSVQPQGPVPTPEEIKQMMDEQAKPAPQHDNLKPLIGTFDAEMNFLLEPGGDPEVTHGTTTNKWILGKKFVQMDFTGKVGAYGVDYPFQGMGILGFDKLSGEYNMMWIDSLSTTMIAATGKAGEDPKEITATDTVMSMMGEAETKHVYKIESNDKHTLEFWQSVQGMDEMMKIGWINYTRKAD